MSSSQARSLEGPRAFEIISEPIEVISEGITFIRCDAFLSAINAISISPAATWQHDLVIDVRQTPDYNWRKDQLATPTAKPGIKEEPKQIETEPELDHVGNRGDSPVHIDDSALEVHDQDDGPHDEDILRTALGVFKCWRLLRSP
ncbi:unnamed protein product [Symbiodinium sp. CCMP2592]|nr:unnamed protein product [Symbiodinium sp. CCMP2592]